MAALHLVDCAESVVRCGMSKTVLIVEDNELNMKLFCDVLESQGYRIIRAYSGMAARQAVSRSLPDIVIMDIQLPDISGLDLIREFKANPLMSDIPVLAVTAFAMKGDQEKIIAAGSDVYLTKPIEILDFIKAVKKLERDARSDSETRNVTDPESPKC